MVYYILFYNAKVNRLKILLNIIIVLYSLCAGAAKVSKPMRGDSCHAFGLLVGQSFLTKAYSNGSDRCVSMENHYIALPGQNHKLFTGMKWQCVEYARRWLIENKGMTFGEVTYAYHIWDLDHFDTVNTHQSCKILRFKNKSSKSSPQVGDLLIYDKGLAITGHVAVVVGVEQGSITIAEQNYFNRPWEGKDYARRLLFDKDAQGNYRIFDDALKGWLRALT